MLVAAAVCPHPPLLVPGVGAGAADELDGLRAACDAAVLDAARRRADRWSWWSAAHRWSARSGDGAWGSLAGVRRPGAGRVGRGRADPAAVADARPVAARTGRTARRGAALLFGVEPDAGTDRCLALGEALAGRADRVAMLVMGDGSARRSVKGPGGLDPDAEPFDAAVAAALADRRRGRARRA